MKKHILTLFSLILVLSLLCACGTDTENHNETLKEKIATVESEGPNSTGIPSTSPQTDNGKDTDEAEEKSDTIKQNDSSSSPSNGNSDSITTNANQGIKSDGATYYGYTGNGKTCQWTFTPTKDGTWGLVFPKIESWTDTLTVKVFDDHYLNVTRDKIGTYDNVVYDSMGVELEQGREYIVDISSTDSSKTNYFEFKFIPPVSPQTIDTQHTYSGKMNFADQVDVYYFTCPVSGKYVFEFTYDGDGFSNFHVKSSKGIRVISTEITNKNGPGLQNVMEVSGEMEAGETYTIALKNVFTWRTPGYTMKLRKV